MRRYKQRIALKMLGVGPPPPQGDRLDRDRTPRHLSGDDVDAFFTASDGRDDPLWGQIDLLLEDLKRYFPVQVYGIRKNLKWLRHQAFKYGLDWGKNKKDY